MVVINERISIPDDELEFSASRSGGPGGQNVNKVSTKVILEFNVLSSASLSFEDKERILERLGNRISKEGVLRVASQGTRSQHSNRELVMERFIELIRAALKQLPIRKKTRMSRAAKQRRLEEKKQHSAIKRERSKRVPIED